MQPTLPCAPCSLPNEALLRVRLQAFSHVKRPGSQTPPRTPHLPQLQRARFQLAELLPPCAGANGCRGFFSPAPLGRLCRRHRFRRGCCRCRGVRGRTPLPLRFPAAGGDLERGSLHAAALVRP